MILLYNINALGQQLPGDVRIHGIITHGGDAPHIIPDYASARFFIRAATWARCEELSAKVRKIAEGAALATGASYKIERFQNEVHDFVLNSMAFAGYRLLVDKELIDQVKWNFERAVEK